MVLNAPHEQTNVRINVNKITWITEISYESANVRENVREIQEASPYEYTNIRTNVENTNTDERTIVLKNVLTYGEMLKRHD